MVWAALLWESLGLVIALHGHIMTTAYEAILQDQVHPGARAPCPYDVLIFQDENATKPKFKRSPIITGMKINYFHELTSHQI